LGAAVVDDVLVVVLLAVLTSFFGTGAGGARSTRFNARSSIAKGSGMVSKGEVALIIAATGMHSELLLPEYFTTFIITIILATLIAPPIKIVFSNTVDSEINSSKDSQTSKIELKMS